MTRMLYFACNKCTAKWFANFKMTTCVRCGSNDVLTTRGTPPWLRQGKGGDEHANGGDHSETGAGPQEKRVDEAK